MPRPCIQLILPGVADPWSTSPYLSVHTGDNRESAQDKFNPSYAIRWLSS